MKCKHYQIGIVHIEDFSGSVSAFYDKGALSPPRISEESMAFDKYSLQIKDRILCWKQTKTDLFSQYSLKNNFKNYFNRCNADQEFWRKRKNKQQIKCINGMNKIA